MSVTLTMVAVLVPVTIQLVATSCIVTVLSTVTIVSVTLIDIYTHTHSNISYIGNTDHALVLVLYSVIGVVWSWSRGSAVSWEALGRRFESSTLAFLFLLFFSYLFFSVEVKTIFTFRNDYP